MQPQHVGLTSVTWGVGPWAPVLTGRQGQEPDRIQPVTLSAVFYFVILSYLLLFSRLVLSDSASPWTVACQASLSFTVFQCVCGEGNGTPLQYSCLENPMDGGAW